MSRTFNFKINREPETLIAKAKKTARQYGAIIEGDSQKGCIAGEGYAADYAIIGNSVQVTVRKKPLLAPWFMVKAAIREFLG